MIIQLLGTGTSMGVPTAGNFSYVGHTGDPRDVRMRCSAWIQVQGTHILIDVGPDFRQQTIISGLNHIDALLITHEHMDHIMGLDDLRPFCYKKKKPIPAFMSPTAKKAILARFDYMFEPNKTPGSVDLDITTVSNEPFLMNDIKIIPIPIFHGAMHVLGYRIGGFTYLSDVNHIPPSSLELIKGSDLLVMSALRWSPKHPTHFTIPEAVSIIESLNVKQAYLIHVSSDVIHEHTNGQLPNSIRLAHDMMRIELN